MHKLAIALTAATALLSAPAFAEGHSWKVGNDSYHIYTSDLDLNTTAGRSVMLARVEKAAGKLCQQPLGVDRKACIAGSLAQASMNMPKLRVALAERNATQVASR